jgi:hypothetical protein
MTNQEAGAALSISLRLRRGVTWSDGKRIEAVVGAVNDPVMAEAADTIEELVEALKGLTGYGEHDDMCSVNSYLTSAKGCTCGLSGAEAKARALLAKLEAGDTQP